jgi:hypothetical protein
LSESFPTRTGGLHFHPPRCCSVVAPPVHWLRSYGAFKDAAGHVIPGSIARMETAIIGGIPQSIWFRDVSVFNPALVPLHGGPSTSESALFRYYNSALEQHFTVVYCGSSAAPAARFMPIFRLRP